MSLVLSAHSSKGHQFILTIIDYFSKWAEAIPLRKVKTSDVIKFIKHHVVYCFGVLRQIIHDNGLSSSTKPFKDSAKGSGSRVFFNGVLPSC